MKQITAPLQTVATFLVTTVLCAVPFHAFITVWASSLLGHYTLLRLWDDVLLLAVFVMCCWWLARDRDVLRWFARSLLVRLIAGYCVLTLLLGIVALAKGEVTGRAFAYGALVNLRFLVWFLAVLLVAQRGTFLRRDWKKMLVYPLAVVTVFAALQYFVLPHNFLSHFGYNAATTIAPIETINHNADYIRVQSTLRGANPLGAYLVIGLSAVLVLYGWPVKRRWNDALYRYGIFALIALYASGSRSAWIGAGLAVGVVLWIRLVGLHQRLILAGVAGGLVVLGLCGFLLLRHNTNVQNEILHTQSNSVVKTTSNGAHASALRTGLRDVVHQPLGDGPGTAGPASVYNTGHSARIAEDYYVQIAQEVGWIGIVLLLAIFGLVAWELYELRHESQLALLLFASFAGLSFVALLSHSWTDDTLAYVWWGFAGIALGRPLKTADKKRARQ